MSDEEVMNDQLVLIAGESAAGKSASLRKIRDQEDWLYLGTEAGKRLPFRNKFERHIITDPYQVHEAFDYATHGLPDQGVAKPDNVKGIIIDSLTFLMDMFETNFVINAANTMTAWGAYQQFFKIMLQQKVASFGKPVIFTAHVKEELNEKAMEMKTSVPIKGALKGNGVEAYFTTVVAAKKVELKLLDKYQSDLLIITDEDKELGYKHVFQTRPTKTTTGERIRSPMGMFSRDQTFMDNDAQLLLDHLNRYYADC
ncbi:hypothetical protein D3C84_48540 [compost metagenome]